jgi:hypothetical protein
MSIAHSGCSGGCLDDDCGVAPLCSPGQMLGCSADGTAIRICDRTGFSTSDQACAAPTMCRKSGSAYACAAPVPDGGT